MKKKNLLFAILFALMSTAAYGQDITVDKILDNYFENTGGRENFKALKGLRMNAKMNQGGMEIAIEILNLSDGRQYQKISLQGNDFMQGVYDGESHWSVNFQSLTPEKSDAEATENFKTTLNDFPDPFLDYKKKGYTVELAGEETIDGAETYKVKITMEPTKVDGKEVETVSFYYFDKEAFVPIAVDTEVQAGPQAGVIQRITQSDYQEVNGFFFPFSLGQGVKGGAMQAITIESIEINPTVDASVFVFPGGK